MTPHFDAAYGVRLGKPKRPAADERLAMLGIGARLEQRDRALRAQELAGEVDRERALPVAQRDVLAGRRRSGDAGVVHQRVEAAERRRHRVEQARDGGRDPPRRRRCASVPGRSRPARRAPRCRRRRRARAHPRARTPGPSRARCPRRPRSPARADRECSGPCDLRARRRCLRARRVARAWTSARRCIITSERSCTTGEVQNHTRPPRQRPPSAGGAMNDSTSRVRRGVLEGRCRRGNAGRAGISRHQPRSGGGDPHRTPDAADRLPRSAGRIRGDGRQSRGRRDQRRRRRDGPQDRTDRRGQRQSADGVDQGGAADRARQGRRDHRRDQLGVGPRDRDGRAAQPDPVLQHRVQLRRAARQVVQPLHVPHRGRQHDVRLRGRPGAAARRHGQGQEVVQPDRRLCVRPRPAEGRQALHGGQRRRVRRRRAGAHRRRRLLGLPAQDPQRQAGPRRLEPGRRADHQLHEAVHGISACRIRWRASASTPRSRGARARAT